MLHVKLALFYLAKYNHRSEDQHFILKIHYINLTQPLITVTKRREKGVFIFFIRQIDVFLPNFTDKSWKQIENTTDRMLSNKLLLQHR